MKTFWNTTGGLSQIRDLPKYFAVSVKKKIRTNWKRNLEYPITSSPTSAMPMSVPVMNMTTVGCS